MEREREGVAVVVSWPEPGRTQPVLTSRLGADIASELAEAFLDDFVATLRALPVDVRLFALNHADRFQSRYTYMDVRPALSPRETFRLMTSGGRRALAVMAPRPDLHPRLFWSAFEMLDRRDAVVGATDRGGLWMLGLRRLHDVFDGVDWGLAGSLERIEENLADAGLDAGYFPGRRSGEDLESLEAMVRRAGPDRARRTRRLVRKLTRARSAAAGA